AGMYIGMTREDVRKQIVKDLDAAGLLEKVEDYNNKDGYSERTNVPIEPKLSMQWFLKMEHLAKIALEPVENGEITFHPAKYKNLYRHWLENIKDWCISRQLWWGHQIPAWYYPTEIKNQYNPNNTRFDFEVAENETSAKEKIRERYKGMGYSDNEINFSLNNLVHQDSDCLDTWFSSWLWPLSLFNGILEPDNEEIRYYYPTADLITAPDIIFFWVARMIMAGEEYAHQVPFRNVYFTGIVRDKLGRKMSKSLGNSPDPIELINKFGADGVRVGMLLTAPAGNDLPFDEALCEQGRNFSNKIWNAMRLVKGWSVDEKLPQSEDNRTSLLWFESHLNKTLTSIEDDFSKYRLSNALMTTYKLVWDDFCSWLLEMIKPAYQQPIDKATYDTVIALFEKLMCMLHPFMPFITEEIWHILGERPDTESIMIAAMPKAQSFDENIIKDFETAKEVIIGVRGLRNSKGISPKEVLHLCERGNGGNAFDGIIIKLCNIDGIERVADKVENALSFMVGSTEYYVPFSQNIDKEAELKKLEEELKYTEGFLNSVMKKLSNERFV
ncbi:MAG: class I tRNA ligase family protein, partial [Bacteroidales bacterium]|nr:class I tRNA ligase family protein [Bacteroidales bacterium]